MDAGGRTVRWGRLIVAWAGIADKVGVQPAYPREAQSPVPGTSGRIAEGGTANAASTLASATAAALSLQAIEIVRYLLGIMRPAQRHLLTHRSELKKRISENTMPP